MAENPAETTQPAQDEAGPTIISEVGVGDKTVEKRLLRGFYESMGGWRWSGPNFAVSVDVPQPLAPTFLELDFAVPAELFQGAPRVTVAAKVNHKEVVRRAYTATGRYFLTASIPPALLKQSPAEVEVDVDKTTKDPSNGRELALNVVGVNLKHYEQTVEGRESEARLSQEGYQRLLQQRRLTMPIEKQKEFMKLFHEIPIWQHMWFHNVQIEKNPLDLWMMQQTIFDIKPDFVVETGTAYGGSALYWAHTLNGMGLENSRVFTMDLDDSTKKASEHPLWKKYVTFFRGSSTDPAIVAKIAQAVKGHKTIVTLDSDHSMSHVLEELKMYAPMVTRHSYLVVEDTNLDGVPINPNLGPGPMAAVRKFLKEGGSKEFEPDPTREAFVITFNPGGWLKRK